MIRALLLFVLAGSALFCPARAIVTSGIAVTGTVTVTNWNTGWSASGVTGSDYVGQVNGSSAVYLGNNWVATAGHVGTGTFTLGGTSYLVSPSTTHAITDGVNTADLILFQIVTAPTLAPLVLSSDGPAAFSDTDFPSQVVMLGYGGSSSLTWGANTVDLTNYPISVASYNSNDFLTITGTLSNGSTVTSNDALVVGGDSGGGDFIYDQARHLWILAGINEVNGQSSPGGPVDVSGFVQLSTYAQQIGSLTGLQVVPEPSTWSLLLLGLALAMGHIFWRRRVVAPQPPRHPINIVAK